MKPLIRALIVIALAIGAIAIGVSMRKLQPTTTSPKQTIESVDSEFKKSTTPIVVLVRSDSHHCKSCADVEALLAQAAGKHPELKFITTYDDVDEPVLWVLVPHIGPTFQKDQFQPTAANIDAFLAKRAEVALKVQAAVERSIKLKAQLDATAKPFDEKIRPFQKQIDDLDRQAQQKEDEAVKSITAEIEKLSAQRAQMKKSKEALALLAVQIDTLELNRQTAIQSFREEHPEVRQKADEAIAVITAQAEPIDKERHEAIKQVLADWRAAQAEVEALLKADQGQ